MLVTCQQLVLQRFYGLSPTIKALHLMSLVSSVVVCTSCKASFGMDLAAPFIQKFQSDLSMLIKSQSCPVKYLFRLPKSIGNGCRDPSWRFVEQSLAVGNDGCPAWWGAWERCCVVLIC